MFDAESDGCIHSCQVQPLLPADTEAPHRVRVHNLNHEVVYTRSQVQDDTHLRHLGASRSLSRRPGLPHENPVQPNAHPTVDRNAHVATHAVGTGRGANYHTPIQQRGRPLGPAVLKLLCGQAAGNQIFKFELANIEFATVQIQLDLLPSHLAFRALPLCFKVRPGARSGPVSKLILDL